MIIKIVKAAAYILVILLIALYVLPNVFNEREENAFSSEVRIAKAREKFNITTLEDSVSTVLSTFYDRGAVVQLLFGTHYRAMWSTEVKVPVLQTDMVKGGLRFLEMGGGQQTTSAEFVGSGGKTFTLRSVDKDQSKALPAWLRLSGIRTLFRDQASAVNPFGALIADKLEQHAGVLHTHPAIWLVPYDSTTSASVRQHLSGRIILLEEEPDSTWSGSEAFARPLEILSTEEMQVKMSSGAVKVDSLEYLKTRLLDFLMSDWDRHGGQWKWAVFKSGDTGICRPIAMDRDMAFYKFDDGLVNRILLLFNSKFQSFTPEYENVAGLIHNSRELDKLILANTSRESFREQAALLNHLLTDKVIESAFRAYPEEIFQTFGRKHMTIFKSRLQKIDTAAVQFYDLLHADQTIAAFSHQ